MGAGSHTGSEEGCNPDGTGINIGAARLAVKDELDHREFWSGRWESNPRPKLGKLLYCHCTTPAHFHTDSLIHDLTTFNGRQDAQLDLQSAAGMSRPGLGSSARLDAGVPARCLRDNIRPSRAASTPAWPLL